MIKKFFAWVKSLFVPVTIKETDVDEYIAARAAEADLDKAHEARAAQVAKATTDTLDTIKTVNVKVTVPDPKRVAEVAAAVKAATEKPKAPATPPKPLDEQLKGVELPSYAQGKKLPPKAKRQFIKQAKTSGSPTSARRLDDTPHSTGGHVASHGIDPVNAAMYGYAAGAILSDDTPSSPAPAPVEECRSSAATSTYSSSYSSSSDDSYSSSSSSSYDSGSYDSGSSYSSCD